MGEYTLNSRSPFLRGLILHDERVNLANNPGPPSVEIRVAAIAGSIRPMAWPIGGDVLHQTRSRDSVGSEPGSMGVIPTPSGHQIIR